MAISEEVRANILRYHHVEKWRVGTIASQLGVHHSTVKRVLSETGVAKNKVLVEQSIIDPFLSFLLEQFIYSFFRLFCDIVIFTDIS